MLASGDVITPQLSHDVAHFSKPPLTYWAIAASVAVFGANEWAVRLPNALAFALTVWLCFAIGKRLDRDRAGWGALLDRQSVVYGTRVYIRLDFGGCRNLKKKN